MKPWLALALLALPLAGCTQTAPAPSPPAAVAGPAAERPVTAPLAEAKLAEEEAWDCPLSPERSEHERVREVIVRVRGCLAVNDPSIGLGVPDDPAADLEVRRGAGSLLVLVHLHGPEPLRASLEDPFDARTRAAAEGGPGRDSYVAFEVAEPAEGRWRVRGAVEELALGRAWSIVAVIAYGTDNAASPS